MLNLKRRFLRGLIAFVLGIMTSSTVDGLDKLRGIEGKAIVASNHLGRLDAGFAFRLVKRNDVIIVVAEKYRSYPIYRWFVRQLDLLWLERFESDLGTLREVLRRLANGGILLIAPEGTRSTTEALMEGEPGGRLFGLKEWSPGDSRSDNRYGRPISESLFCKTSSTPYSNSNR